MCYEMLGDVECATAYFKLLLPWIRKVCFVKERCCAASLPVPLSLFHSRHNQNYEYDELVQRKAKHYLAHGGFSPYEHQYFIASVSFEACRYAEALEHMKKVRHEMSSWLSGVSCLAALGVVLST